jgi:CBS domain-containing protein
MTVAQFIDDKRGPIVSAGPRESVASIIKLFAERRIGCVPIIEDGRVIGIFSERDVVHGLSSLGSAFLDRAVADVMTVATVTISPDTPVLTALSLMTKRRFRHLPIVEDGHMVGFVSIGDLVKSRIDRIEAEADAMRAYIQSA